MQAQGKGKIILATMGKRTDSYLTHNVLGIMSGTSVDGVDIVLCRFSTPEKYQILSCKTYPYPKKWHQRLKQAHRLTARELRKTDVELGIYLGQLARKFLSHSPHKANYIASHGHTVFHVPNQGYTLQIGCGASMAAITGLTVINDFRTGDIALGGQGAPLVPIGDELLFSQYVVCLNLGGIANLSYTYRNERVAYDITVCNMALNELAQRNGKSYDKNGNMARNGKVNYTLLKKMNSLPYFRKKGPKSIGREWYDNEFNKLLKGNTNNLLATVCEHIGQQTGCVQKTGKMLVTGGGAHNDFLIERIQLYTSLQIVRPGKILIDFKEAVVFSLLGYLRMHKVPNVLASVTGARKNHCAGTLWLP